MLGEIDFNYTGGGNNYQQLGGWKNAGGMLGRRGLGH